MTLAHMLKSILNPWFFDSQVIIKITILIYIEKG